MTFEVYIDLYVVGSILVLLPIVVIFTALGYSLWCAMRFNEDDKRSLFKFGLSVALGLTSFVIGCVLLDMHAREQKELEAQQIEHKDTK